jgi:hypothetical protein
MIDLGDVVPLTLTIKDPVTGLPANASAVVCTITAPDQTISTPTVGNTVTGTYTVQFTTAQYGQHRVRWVATGTNAGAFTDEFTVEGDYQPFVSLGEQLAWMRGTTVITSTADLETLRFFIRVSCESVEADLDRSISLQTRTQTIDGGTAGVVLYRPPVVSIVSVVENGTTLATTDYVANLAAGLLYRGQASAPRAFLTGIQNVVITTRNGCLTSIPTVARTVAMKGAQRLWQQSQQMPHPSMDDLGAEGTVNIVGQLTPLEWAAYQKLKIGGIG